MSSKLGSGLVKETKLYFADVSALVDETDDSPNTRFDLGSLTELEHSIKTQGFRKSRPLEVRRREDGKLLVRTGRRRFAAIRNLIKAGHKFPEGIPVVLEERGTTDIQTLVSIYTENNGKPFLPLEEAAMFLKMRNSGMTVKNIMAATGKSDMHICDTMALVEADETLRQALADGKLGSTVAKQIAIKARGNKPEQARLATKAATGKKGTAEVKEELARKRIKKFSKGPVVRAQRVLTAGKLESLDEKLSAEVKELLTSVGITQGRLKAFLKESDERSLSFAAGLLRGIRVARGVETDTSL